MCFLIFYNASFILKWLFIFHDWPEKKEKGRYLQQASRNVFRLGQNTWIICFNLDDVQKKAVLLENYWINPCLAEFRLKGGSLIISFTDFDEIKIL